MDLIFRDCVEKNCIEEKPRQKRVVLPSLLHHWNLFENVIIFYTTKIIMSASKIQIIDTEIVGYHNFNRQILAHCHNLTLGLTNRLSLSERIHSRNRMKLNPISSLLELSGACMLFGPLVSLGSYHLNNLSFCSICIPVVVSSAVMFE